MNEVKKCSISGISFTLDTDAYETLENYLGSLKKSYKESSDGAEIVADIEARIAELILSAQDNARVVEKPLIMNIIQQLGTAEDITEASSDDDLRTDTPRIPRRLYRDTENARLGGVCSGIGKYFDTDPVWVRLGLFLPLILACLGGLPLFGGWMSQIFGNLFGIFLICYLIMWFVVPAARSARQKLEMTGERITEQSIRNTTGAAASDPDSKARPIVAEAVSVFGKVVLICLKIFAGLIVFGLIMAACALIIAMFAVMAGGHELITPFALQAMPLSLPILGIFIALIPVILLIYVLMCLIASRKPGGKAVLAIFLLWIASIVACSIVAVRSNVVHNFRMNHNAIEEFFDDQVIIDSDTTTLKKLLTEMDDITITDEDDISLNINVPSKQVNITIDKQGENVKVSATHKEVSITRQSGDDDSVKITKRVVVEQKAAQ